MSTRIHGNCVSIDTDRAGFAALVRLVAKFYGEHSRISAIKDLRAITGLGLREAKVLIEATYVDTDPVMTAIEQLKNEMNQYRPTETE